MPETVQRSWGFAAGVGLLAGVVCMAQADLALSTLPLALLCAVLVAGTAHVGMRFAEG